jgi:hypothetical protein
MKIYNYNPITKAYLGKDVAKKDPLETKKQGKPVFLMPAHSTTVKPEVKPGFHPFWADAWFNKVDKRGTKYFMPGSVEPIIIKEVGVDLPEGASLEVDPDTLLEHLRSEANDERKGLYRDLQNDFVVNVHDKDWDFSLRTVSLFNGMVTLNQPFEWRPKDEDYQTLTVAQGLEIGLAIKVKLGQLDQASQRDKAAIQAGDYSNSNLKVLVGG